VINSRDFFLLIFLNLQHRQKKRPASAGPKAEIIFAWLMRQAAFFSLVADDLHRG
jgi:hypothetical protein